MKKRLNIFIAVLFAVLMTVAAEGFTLSETSSRNFTLYDAYGQIVDNSEPITDGGYIIATNSDPILYESEFGDIRLGAYSLFAITSVDPVDPSIYLIDGEANFYIKQEFPLSIFTPTSCLMTDSVGEYYIITSSHEELFLNLSEGDAEIYDSITNMILPLDSLTFTSMTTGMVNVQVGKDTYDVFSYFRKMEVLDPVPTAPRLSAARFLVPETPSFRTTSSRPSPKAPEVYVVDKKIPYQVTDEEKVDMEARLMESIPSIAVPAAPDLKVSNATLLLEPPMVRVIDNRNATTQQTDTVISSGESGNIIIPFMKDGSDIISGERKKNTFSFDFLLKMRASEDSRTGESALVTTVVPRFQYGDFALELSLDPLRIMNIAEVEDASLPFYLSYGMSFIEGLYFRSFDERTVVALDKKNTLFGDSVGLFDGIVHDWDGVEEKLSFNIQTKSDNVVWRLYSPDLSFNNWDEENPLLSFGTDLKLNPSKNWAVSLGLELMCEIPYLNSENSALFPAFYIEFPFLDNDRSTFGMRFAYIMGLDDLSFQTFDWKNMGVLFSFPFSFPGINFNIGGMYQSGNVYYNRMNYSYENLHNTDAKLALFAEGDVISRYVDFSINTFMNFDTSSMKFLTEESYLDFSLGFTLGNIDLIIGARKQNISSFEEFLNNTDSYVGLKAVTGSLSSEMLFRFTEGKPQITYNGTIAMIDPDNVENRNTSRPVDLKFDIGFERIAGELLFEFTPILRFGTADNYFAFRTPLNLRMKDGMLDLAPIKGDEWWRMFEGPIDKIALYDSITDIFTLIDSFKFGSEETIIYLEANRNMRMNDILFDNYASIDALSLKGGLKFKNLDFNVFLDDLESPKIVNLFLGIYPFSSDSFGLIFSAPTEFMLRGKEDYTVKSFPGITIRAPFLSERLLFNVFAYGEMTAVYNPGDPAPKTEVLWDFENNEFYGYLLGGEIKWDDPKTFMIGISGGIHSGLLAPNMFNAFTAFNPSLSVSAPAAENSYPVMPIPADKDEKPEEDVEDLSYWLIADFAIYFDSFNMYAKYSIPDMVKMINNMDEYTRDIFTLGLDFTLPNGVGMEIGISRQAFASTIKDMPKNPEGYFRDPKTLYSASITKSFDNLSLKAEFKTGAIWEKRPGIAINTYENVKAVPSFSISTRIGF